MIYRSGIKASNVEGKVQLLKDSKEIVIFGTGNYGGLALHALKKLGLNVTCFCDNNASNWGAEFKGHKVISPRQLLTEFAEATVLTASLRFKHMVRQMKGNPGLQPLNCDFLFSEIDLSDISASVTEDRLVWMLDLYNFTVDAENDRERLKIKSLDIVVTEKCSLRCKDCSNLMQYYEAPQDTEIEALLGSLRRFMENVDALHEARLIGGEPFMFKKLPQVISLLAGYEHCRKITIFTNGTIVPKGEMLEALGNEKVSLIVSDYGSLSKNTSALKAVLEEKRIPFIAEEVDQWQDCARIAYRERTKEELMDMFGDCCVNDSLTLLHGKLYTCPFAAHVTNLRAIPPEYYDDDVDLMSLDDAMLKEKIRMLYSGKDYLGACSYCAGRDYSVGRIEAAIQALSPIPIKKYIEVIPSTH